MKLLNSQTQHRARTSLDDSMIPAINIVFLLLIFFMLAGHIEARNEQLLIPNANSENDLITQDIEIQARADGLYFINGKQASEPLITELQALQVSSESTVTLHIHRDLPASALDPVLMSTRQLGIKKLLLATVQQP